MQPEPPDDSRQRSADAIDDANSFAEYLESLPPVEPRPEWLAESKRRLLERFDEQQVRSADQDAADP